MLYLSQDSKQQLNTYIQSHSITTQSYRIAVPFELPTQNTKIVLVHISFTSTMKILSIKQ